MAEAAGLAIGGIALISLFQSCLDFLDYIESVKDCEYSVNVSITKLSILGKRLDRWGDVLAVNQPVHEDDILRKRWLIDSQPIMQGLSHIRSILKAAKVLSERYRLGPSDTTPRLPRLATRGLGTTLTECGGVTAKSAKRRLHLWRWKYDTSPPQGPSLGGKLKWALKDKKRFHSLLLDLDFFITNLEDLGMASNEGTFWTSRSLHPHWIADRCMYRIGKATRRVHASYPTCILA